VALLSTGGGWPHAIPVSTIVRASSHRVLFALARRRESLSRLRSDPRCALTILAGGDVACSAHGRARVVEDPMAVAERVAAIALDVEVIQDHTQPRFAVDAGVQWRWVEEDARERDRVIRAALAALAGLG